MKKYVRCEPHQKYIYPSEEIALHVAAVSILNGLVRAIWMRAYESCGGWHLTSKASYLPRVPK
jgi:hypothetical protein